MIIKKKGYKEKVNIYAWHQWFAWHPVFIRMNNNTYFVWFERIERKATTYKEIWEYKFINQQ